MPSLDKKQNVNKSLMARISEAHPTGYNAEVSLNTGERINDRFGTSKK